MRAEEGLYVLGCLERRVTLHAQQIRALNLVYSLRELDIVPPGGRILVVGGGVAGLTAAAGAARLGMLVTLLEREPELLHIQRNTTKRWIHPNIYDWPEPHATEAEASVPLLRWKAAPAGEVVKQILAAFEALPERDGIELHADAQLTDLGSGAARHVFWQARGNHDACVSAVILAVGFGLERDIDRVELLSYWQDDSLDHALTTSGRRILVSGTGDGGLIDVLRAQLRDFRHDTMIDELVGDAALKPVKERLLAIEREALAAERRQEGSGSKYLFDAYKKLSDDCSDLLSKTVDENLRKRLRDNATVFLNGGDSSPFSLGASMLSRFLVSRLYFRFNLPYRSGRLTRPPRGPRNYEVPFKLGSQTFDQIVWRHGPVSALAKDFSDIWSRCGGKLRDFATLDQTRWPIYGDAFGRVPSSGSGSAMSSAETEGEARTTTLDHGPALATYLARIREEAGQVTLTGDTIARPIQDVFVELEVTRGGTIDRKEPGEEENLDPFQSPGDLAALQTELRRRKSAPWRKLTETIPAHDLLDFAHRTLIIGAAGTGKSTLLRWLACEAAKRCETDEKARIPVWLGRLPEHEDIKGSLADGLAKRALAKVNLDEGPSEARLAIRDAIASGRALILIDSLDESGVVAQAHAAEWLAKLNGRVVLASRPLIEGTMIHDVVTVTLHGIPGIAAEQLLRKYFAGEDWVDGLLEELRSLPDGQMWLETPVLLGLAATLYRADGTLPQSIIDLYRRAVVHLLNSERLPQVFRGDALRGELRNFAREHLLPKEGAPRVIFDASEVPYGRQEIFKLTGLFEGGARLRFTHLTLGEYLAAEAEIDLAAERAKLLALPGQTSEGSSLEVVPMAYALRGTAVLQAALAEAREHDLADHRLLRLLLRALGYGGEGVQAFCSTHASDVIRLIAERLDAPSGRFGESEVALMDAAERAFLAMRGLVDKAEVERAFARLLRLPGDAGTEAHVATWILGIRDPERRESNWWPTIERQARALVRENVGIDGVLELTEGVDSQNQGRAACRLAKYPKARVHLRHLLYSRNDVLGRRWLGHNLASEPGVEPDWRERLSDEDRTTREWCVENIAKNLTNRPIYLPRLRYMLVHDPSDEVRAAVVNALAEDSGSRNAIRNILSTTFNAPSHVSGDFMQLRSAAMCAMATDAESEELIRAYVTGPKVGVLEELYHPLRRLIKVPKWREVLLQRLNAPDVTTREIEVLAEDPAAREPLKKLLDSNRNEIVHAAAKTLGASADRSRLIQLIDHNNQRVRCAAIAALGQHPSTEPLLRKFLTGSAMERIAAAKALVHDVASLGDIRDNLLRYRKNEVRVAAVEVLSVHPIAFAELREYFEETRSKPEHEWLTDEAGHPIESISHGGLRARILDALATDQRYRCLVENALDDPHDSVKGAAVQALANDPSMVDRLQQLFYSPDHGHQAYEAFCDLMSHHSFVLRHLLFCLNVDQGELRFSAFRYLVDHVEERKRLTEMLSTPDTPEDWRATIVGPLARDPSLMDQIRACVDDTSDDVRAQTLRLLRHDRMLRLELRERARSKEWMATTVHDTRAWRRRDGILSVLAGDPEAHPILASYLDVDDAMILTVVAPMLREYPEARPRLVELLKHPSVDVQAAAMHALGGYEPAREKIAAALAPDPPVTRGPDTDMRALIHRSSQLRALRKAAAEALKDVAELRVEFRALLDNEDVTVRGAAIHSVSADRSPEALQLLRERLRVEEDEGLRFRIIEALRSDAGSVEPLRDRLHNDYTTAVRQSAARALGLGDLSPAYAVRDLPSVARVREVLSGVVTPGLEALQAFLATPRRVDMDAEPDLFEQILAWSCARLTWAYEIEREREGQVLGEVATPIERLAHPGGVILIRVAKDTFSLPIERYLRPNHNLMEVWDIARHLVASNPPTVVLACADVAYAHIQPPPIEPGNVWFGPTFFGFRIHRSDGSV